VRCTLARALKMCTSQPSVNVYSYITAIHCECVHVHHSHHTFAQPYIHQSSFSRTPTPTPLYLYNNTPCYRAHRHVEFSPADATAVLDLVEPVLQDPSALFEPGSLLSNSALSNPESFIKWRFQVGACSLSLRSKTKLVQESVHRVVIDHGRSVRW
jgi:hypothetical protein